jgi:hypothetical protein
VVGDLAGDIEMMFTDQIKLGAVQSLESGQVFC